MTVKEKNSRIKGAVKHQRTCWPPPLIAVAVAVAIASILVMFHRALKPAADAADFPQDALMVPGAGDMGEPVTLAAEEQELAQQLFQQEGFNVVASDKLPHVRRLKDVRPALCHNRTYDSDLPSASIIINFYNEVWSALLRTVHSVLARTPDHLLHEIVLVDDASTKEELGAQLDRYLAERLPEKVKLHRLKERVGLIKGRHLAAQKASGEVIIFLDSHVEPLEIWIEPLLQRLRDQPHSLVCPTIDNIRDKDMHYQEAERAIGGFLWSGHFKWIHAGAADGVPSSDEAAPVRSPVMSGGLYAMRRDYFWHLGGYDTGMDVYGGENLEISFRVWQCGGVVETLPCSRVGHIFRDFHPYSFPRSNNPLGANMARVATVWMDEYARYFFMHYIHEESPPQAGDVSERQALRRRLGCKPFRWFLDTVYPNKLRLDEDVRASGQLRSRLRPDLCVDTLIINKVVYLGFNTCTDPVVSGQYLSYSKAGEFRREDSCAYVSEAFPGQGTQAPLRDCQLSTPAEFRWSYDEETGQLKHDESGLCVDGTDVEVMHLLRMEPCSDAPGQGLTFVSRGV